MDGTLTGFSKSKKKQTNKKKNIRKGSKRMNDLKSKKKIKN